jgi:hypothetical protein
MIKPIRYFLFVLSIFIYPTIDIYAQVSSPYSMFGLGYIEGNSVGVSNAMGGTGIAFKSGNYINHINPASYSGLDSLYTLYDFGLEAKYTAFKNNKDRQTLFDGNFKYIAMGFRLTSRIATSFGVTPYSTVDYNIGVLTDLEGSNESYYKNFTGEGGVNQLYVGGSYNVSKNLALGINAVYLFGTINNSENVTGYNYSLEDITYLSNFNLNYGLNYQFEKNKWKYNLGIVYNNGKSLKTDHQKSVTTYEGTDVIESRNNSLKLPRTFGIGFSIEKKLFKSGFDFETKKWRGLDLNNPLLETRNSNRYSVGIEIPSTMISRGNSNLYFFRLGAEYNKSYLIINGTPINYKAITFGSGIPLRGMLSVINLSMEIGQNGTTSNNLIKENFYILHIDLSLKDLWFMKRKYL